ncbi:MAG: DUF1684 domain-containing protein [Bacteroidota bacterium]|nr:DUF1684 domain-containing protein [Bacteroidota bacterium]
MKRDHIVFIVVGIIIGIIIFYSLQEQETEESYTGKIIKERKSIHDFMLSSEESPIEAADREDFESLKYFAVKVDYRIKARFSPLEKKEKLMIPTSTGEEQSYVKVGYALFSMDSREHKLLLLEPEKGKSNELFLAFADETSGAETYGGGRYINVPKPTGSVVTIDFNLAYNPYCAYNPEFNCPLPPKENILRIPIAAGEKDFKKQP